MRRDALVLPNRKNPSRPVKAVFLSAGDQDLPEEILIFAREHAVSDAAPLFASRKRGRDGERPAIGREQAWRIVKEASQRAGVRVLALRLSHDGQAGEPQRPSTTPFPSRPGPPARAPDDELSTRAEAGGLVTLAEGLVNVGETRAAAISAIVSAITLVGHIANT